MEPKESPDYSTVEELIQAWKDVRRDLVSFLTSLPENIFSQKIDSSWSIAETAEHLYLCQLPVGILIKKKIKGESSSLPVPDYKTLANEIIHRRGIQNPEFVAPSHMYHKEEIIGLLNQAEVRMEKSLVGITKEDLVTKIAEHPVAGKVNLFDWIWIMVLHEYRHLKFMQEKVTK